MPVHVKADLTPLTQREFSDISYEVMAEAFAVHKQLGSLFDEVVYRNALAIRLKEVVTEVQIDVIFDDFKKSYFVDALVSGGGVFELKSVRKIVSRHRDQLLNYLLLLELKHGKLINFGSRQVEHEFVNTTLTQADRTSFRVDDTNWVETEQFGLAQKQVILDFLHDWGTGLDHILYEDALHHFVLVTKDPTRMNVFQHGQSIGLQAVQLCGAFTAVRLTTFQDNNSNYRLELCRLMQATKLASIQWINIARNLVTFETLHYNSS
jgi:GxxExxY protein